jgi:hypothetical protein
MFSLGVTASSNDELRNSCAALICGRAMPSPINRKTYFGPARVVNAKRTTSKKSRSAFFIILTP